MKKILFSLALIFCATQAMADGRIRAVDFTTEAGIENADYDHVFDVELLSDVEDIYTSLQFDMYLPEGMELLDADDNFDPSKDRFDWTTGRNPSCKATIEVTPKDGYYLITLYHTNLEKIHGTSGAILSFYYTTSQDMAAGSYNIKIANQVLSKSGAAEDQEYPEDQFSTVTIASSEPEVIEVGKAIMATEIEVSEAYSELGKDISAAGGKDRAAAKVTYKYFERTFMSDGTFQDGEMSEQQEKTIYSEYTQDVPTLGKTEMERTLVATLQPTGNLMTIAGEALKHLSEDFETLEDAVVSTEQPLDIYQEANLIEEYGEVEFGTSIQEIEVDPDGATIYMSERVNASQTATYTSQATGDCTVEISYEVKTPAEGFSLDDAMVTAEINESESAKTFVITAIARGEGDKTATLDFTFTQAISTTGISFVGADKTAVVYDLNGRVVSLTGQNLQKGVYIKNNRKFIVK